MHSLQLRVFATTTHKTKMEYIHLLNLLLARSEEHFAVHNTKMATSSKSEKSKATHAKNYKLHTRDLISTFFLLLFFFLHKLHGVFLFALRCGTRQRFPHT